MEGKCQAEVARELGIVEQTLHSSRKAHRDGKLSGVSSNGAPITAEQMEIAKVRAVNARLKMEIEILIARGHPEKATAYFSKELLCSTPGSNATSVPVRAK